MTPEAFATKCVAEVREDELFNVLTDDKWRRFIAQTVRAAIAEQQPVWLPIETAPEDTSQGDFLISHWNRRGDLAWINICRNPQNNLGMATATHWARLFEPDGESVAAQQDRLDAMILDSLLNS